MVLLALAAGCVAEQIEKHTQSITDLEKTLEDQSKTLQEMRATAQKTDGALGELATRADGLDGAIQETRASLEERIFEEKQARETQMASVEEWKAATEDRFKGTTTELDSVKAKVLTPEEGPSNEQLATDIQEMKVRVPELETQLQETERKAILARQAMGDVTSLRNEVNQKFDGLRERIDAAREAQEEPTLAFGIPVKTGGMLGLLAFIIVLFVLILHFATRSAITKKMDATDREVQDLAAAQRVQSRMASQPVKPALEDEGAMKESIEAFKVTLEQDDKRVRHLHAMGSSFMDLGSFRIAKEWFDAVLKIKPDYTDALIERATCQAMLGNYKEADISLEKALKQNKDHPRAWYNKACVSAKLGNDAEMFNAISEAIQRDPDAKERFKEDPDFRKYWAHPEFTRRTS
jgi:tetratricopeptide (TPR) repeat protein